MSGYWEANKREQTMNPIALGMIVLGIILLFFGATSLRKNKKTMGLVLLSAGILALAFPFIVTYLLYR